MKTKTAFFIIILTSMAAVFFVSCDDSDEIDTVWKEANEAIFAEISHNPDYSKKVSHSKNGYIMYKELESGYGEIPIFTDSVKVLYKGWYKKDWTKADTYTDSKGNRITNKIIFDSSPRNGELPTRLKVSDLIDGFATALQNMQEGDKWEVWIPWRLGYGSTDYGNIPAYTTLVFEIELLEVDDSEKIDTIWKEANEAIFDEISHNPVYSKIFSQSKNGYIMYKGLESGYGVMPIFTDSVKVLYKGWYKKDWTKADTYTDSKGNRITNKIIFDSSPRNGELPTRLKVSDLIDGFATALQNMQEGDKWEVWIPWKLGYGETTYGSIPAYTTLVFEIKLLEVIN